VDLLWQSWGHEITKAGLSGRLGPTPKISQAKRIEFVEKWWSTEVHHATARRFSKVKFDLEKKAAPYSDTHYGLGKVEFAYDERLHLVCEGLLGFFWRSGDTSWNGSEPHSALDLIRGVTQGGFRSMRFVALVVERTLEVSHFGYRLVFDIHVFPDNWDSSSLATGSKKR